MQLFARPAPGVATTRKSSAAPARLTTVRPSLARSFREGDSDAESSSKALQESKERVEQTFKGGVQEVKKTVQQAAAEPRDAHFDAQVRANPAVPAFTRRREVFVGRLAIVGIVAAGFWETVLPGHPNILQQISQGLNLVGLDISPGIALTLIAGSVVYSGLVAVYPGNPTFSQENIEDVQKRPTGNVSGWGFTKKNELFNGRVAMLGFTAAIVNQLFFGGLTGPGPLAQVAAYLRVPADELFYGAVPVWFLGFTACAAALAYLRGQGGEKTRFGEKDIY